MTQPTYTITITNDERKMLVFCMGAMLPSIRQETVRLLNVEEFSILSNKLLDAKPDREAITAASNGKDIARAVLAPAPPAPSPTVAAPSSTIRDRWARDRKGKEVPNPEGCTSLEVRIVRTEERKPSAPGKPPFLKVTYESPSGTGFADANCFDVNLWPAIAQAAVIANTQNGKVLLHTVRAGNYVNVIGVRA